MIGIIADDLTGAAEIGAVGLRHGLRAEIIVADFKSRSSRHESALNPPKRKSEPTHVGCYPPSAKACGSVDLLCIDTESRSCTPAEAGRRAAAAAQQLIAAGADWIYKKTDSVLRGQVVAELEAILRRLYLPLALLLPANPSLGRVIQRGRYFIHGRPLHRTEFARDPEHPRRSSRVLELLAAPKSLEIQMCRLQQDLPSSGIVGGEAGTPANLREWASKAWDLIGRSQILPSGGAEFFGALLTAAGHKLARRLPREAARPRRRCELFVCGSTSESSREFVSQQRARGTPVFSLPEVLLQGRPFTAAMAKTIARRVAAAFRSHDRVILHVGLPPVRQRALATRLSSHLAQVAERLLRGSSVTHVYAEGGATAVELVRRMGWHTLTVLRELAPGVATLAVADQPSLRLTIKPGTYSWPYGSRCRQASSV